MGRMSLNKKWIPVWLFPNHSLSVTKIVYLVIEYRVVCEHCLLRARDYTGLKPCLRL